MRLPYSLRILIRERRRYLPAALAITFSTVLVWIQTGLLLGFIESVTRQLDRTPADLWVGSRDLPALGYSHPIEEQYYARLASQPEVEQVGPYVYGLTMWHRADGKLEQCFVCSTPLQEGAVGVLADLSPGQRSLLTRPGTVALYDPDRKLLGLANGVGTVGEINGHRVEVVAILHGPSKAMGLMPGLICSLRTARWLLPALQPDEVTFLIARCRHPQQADVVARRLQSAYPEIAVFTRAELTARTRTYWLTKTRAGIALAVPAMLGLLVGGVILSQTFYSAAMASWRELAVLRRLGVPQRRMQAMLLIQALAVAFVGLALAVPVTVGLNALRARVNVQALLPPEMILALDVLLVAVAILADLVALRALHRIEPANLLR